MAGTLQCWTIVWDWAQHKVQSWKLLCSWQWSSLCLPPKPPQARRTVETAPAIADVNVASISPSVTVLLSLVVRSLGLLLPLALVSLLPAVLLLDPLLVLAIFAASCHGNACMCSGKAHSGTGICLLVLGPIWQPGNEFDKYPVVWGRYLQTPVVQGGYLQIPVVRSGYLQISVVRGGYLQIPVVQSGYLQIPVVRGGYLLNTSACFSEYPLVG